jgi:hypothetical protein
LLGNGCYQVRDVSTELVFDLGECEVSVLNRVVEEGGDNQVIVGTSGNENGGDSYQMQEVRMVAIGSRLPAMNFFS